MGETEHGLGLRAVDGEKTMSVRSVSHTLLTIMNKAELDIRTFLGVKAVIDTASEVVGVSFSDGAASVGRVR